MIDRLHKAATEGRIAAEELEHRVSAALKARSYAELDATVSDLPGPPRRSPARGRPSGARWTLSVVRENPILLLFAIPALVVTTALLLAATIVWTVLMVVFLMVGGRRGMMRGPWVYARRHGPPGRGRHPHRQGSRPGRGPGGHWA